MAVVLVFRPQGLFGLLASPHDAVRDVAQKFRGLQAGPGMLTATILLLGLACAAWWGGPYWQTLAADALILMIFGISLQAMMGLGGLVSFGHAAFFALGGYGAALSHSLWGVSLPVALARAVQRLWQWRLSSARRSCAVPACTWRCCRWRWRKSCGLLRPSGSA